MGNFVLLSPITRRPSGDGGGRWIRRGVMVGALAVGAGLLAGVSGASSPSTSVNFTPLTPPFKVINNAFVGANATKTVVIIGGNTQVPTNATTVQLTVTAKGTKAGTLSFYPTGNPAGATGQTISWPANGTATGTIETDIGQKNGLNVKNTSLASATVSATITGYSTEVEARDISGIGGTAGQTLVNDGTGGVVWGEPGRAYSSYQAALQSIGFQGAIMRTVTVPAGAYVLSFNGTVVGSSATPDFAHCWLFTPNFFTIVNGDAAVGSSVPRSTMAMQGVVTLANGGSLHAFCWSQGGQPMSMANASLIAQSVGTVGGSVTSALQATNKGLPTR